MPLNDKLSKLSTTRDTDDVDDMDSGDVEVDDCSDGVLIGTLCGVASRRFISSASLSELVTTFIGLMKVLLLVVCAEVDADSPLVYLLITESTRSFMFSLNWCG